MKKILQHLLEHKTLTQEEAYQLMLGIGKGDYTNAELAALTTIYLMHNITIPELIGFKQALYDMCNQIQFDGISYTDIVGTGGDNKNTFNISTTSALVVAGAGYKVVKHGNYAVSSTSGSSNVLENLGYTFTNDKALLTAQLQEANCTFLHAPLFHPALAKVATVRKELGIRTIFNLLGPLVNPACPQYQVLGVYNLEVARLYEYVLQQGTTTYSIVHTYDGYDEATLTSDTKIIKNNGSLICTPEQLGKRTVQQADLYSGNSVGQAATILTNVLTHQATWAQQAVVLANAAIAISNMNTLITYQDAYNQAVESLESGRAYQCLQSLIQ